MQAPNVSIDLSDLIAQEQQTANLVPMSLEPEATNGIKTAYIQWNRHENQWHAIYDGRVIMKNSSKQYGDNILLRSIEKQTNRKVQLMGITHGVIVSEDFKIPNGPEKVNTSQIMQQLQGAPLDFSKHTLS